jgi:transposase
VDDRRVLSGIIFINRNGLRWCDAPRDYGPSKTLNNRWKRWSGMEVFARIMEGLASAAAEPKTVMIDATYLKAHRTASSLLVKKGARKGHRAQKRRPEHQVSCHRRRQGTATEVLRDGGRSKRLYRSGGPVEPYAGCGMVAGRPRI